MIAKLAGGEVLPESLDSSVGSQKFGYPWATKYYAAHLSNSGA
jgi:hypothetical protein